MIEVTTYFKLPHSMLNIKYPKIVCEVDFHLKYADKIFIHIDNIDELNRVFNDEYTLSVFTETAIIIKYNDRIVLGFPEYDPFQWSSFIIALKQLVDEGYGESYLYDSRLYVELRTTEDKQIHFQLIYRPDREVVVSETFPRNEFINALLAEAEKYFNTLSLFVRDYHSGNERRSNIIRDNLTEIKNIRRIIKFEDNTE